MKKNCIFAENLSDIRLIQLMKDAVMTKYNIIEKQEREAAYRSLVSPALMDDLKEKILNVIVMQKKYKDKNYSAKHLAIDLGTNTRYISAVVNVRFHMNYTSFVNKYRIEEAMSILVDKRYQHLRIEEVSDMVGFANRQSFYASFYKITGITPKEYKVQHLASAAAAKKEKQMTLAPFNFSDERFADLQMLRYRLNGFEKLTLNQKRLVYFLVKATLYGRDITFDQFGKHNLRIRKTLEVIYSDLRIPRDNDDFRALQVYLKRVWFSNGIYHHYGCEKFKPGFSADYLKTCMNIVDAQRLPLREGQSVNDFFEEIAPVIFDEKVLTKRVNKVDGEDLVATSACNFYQDVTQEEAEKYYASLKQSDNPEPPSYGLNTTLVKEDGVIKEEVWSANGKYANAIRHIVYWLTKAAEVAENEDQKETIELLIKYYQTGDLKVFDEYSIKWLQTTGTKIDFINGFIEVYGDPLGLKGSWEGLVEYIDEEATSRTRTISNNAQWFEDHSPVDPRFKKKVVKGVSANVICAAMLGGDEYPSTAIGINLPNADWIRANYGSKSITISNITEAYSKAAHGNGFREEFIKDPLILELIEKYDDVCDDLHTDLHECLGHGSGQLLPDRSRRPTCVIVP